MEIHSFRVDIATKYGIAEAILLGYFYHWVKKNELSDINFYDGYYWTFDTSRELSKKHPYLSSPTIHRIIHKLEANGLIITGNYNKVSYDKTKWYTLTKKGESLFQNETALFQDETTIPINKEEKSKSLFQDETTLFQDETTIPIQTTNSLEREKYKKHPNPEQFPGWKYSSAIYEKAINVYERFIEPVQKAATKESILSCVDDYGLEEFEKAVKVAARNNARRLAYIEACLKNADSGGEKNGERKGTVKRNGTSSDVKRGNRKSKGQTSQKLGPYV